MLSDRYQLGEVLGYGGMFLVHRGRDIRLGREVAIKILRPDLARDEKFRRIFRAAAQNAAALKHLTIATVYDADEAPSDQGPLPYIVTEYVVGHSLRDIMDAQGAIPPEHAMQIMVDVCAALEFAHRHRIAHLGLKPSNVMISKTGAVKVTDFGLNLRSGSTVNARTDLFAAGSLLHELVTGAPPTTSGRGEPQPPSRLNTQVNAALDGVVLKALATGHTDRYRSATEMRDDLLRIHADHHTEAPQAIPDRDRTQRIAAGPTRPPKPRKAPRRRRADPMTPIVALGVAAILVAAWFFLPLEGERVAAIPTIVGQPYAAAVSELREAGFIDIQRKVVPCWSTEYGNEPPCTADDDGKVLRTKPPHGAHIDVSTQVLVYVGQAPTTQSMADLTGTDRAHAKKVISRMNLHLNPKVARVENKDPAKADTVAAQDPKPGVAVAEGDVVTLQIYAKPKLIQVSDYVGEEYDVAEAGLSAAGFTVVREDVDSTRPQGVVVSQNPDSGEALDGSDVVLKVSNGEREPITMPDR